MFEARLREVSFFGDLSKRELAMVAQSADEVDVEVGKDLVVEGDIGHEFFVIIDGTAEVLRDGTPIAELGPGEFFGEMALCGEDRRLATVRAISPMRLLVMTRRRFRDIDRAIPQLSQKVTEAIHARRAALQAASTG